MHKSLTLRIYPDKSPDDCLFITCTSCFGLGSRLPVSAKGKGLKDFQGNQSTGILSNLRFCSLEIKDTSVTKGTNNNAKQITLLAVDQPQSSPNSVNLERVFECPAQHLQQTARAALLFLLKIIELVSALS